MKAKLSASQRQIICNASSSTDSKASAHEQQSVCEASASANSSKQNNSQFLVVHVGMDNTTMQFGGGFAMLHTLGRGPPSEKSQSSQVRLPAPPPLLAGLAMQGFGRKP